MNIDEHDQQVDTSSHDIIYALRTAHQHQSRLLLIADQKANILVGIVAVILTILVTRSGNILAMDNELVIPIASFVILELIALVLALMVITPKLSGQYKATKVEDMPNPLFFGFFTRYPQSDYMEFIAEDLINDQAARKYLTRDIYQIGHVLKRKYSLLRYAYIFAVLGVAFLAATSLLVFYIYNGSL